MIHHPELEEPTGPKVSPAVPVLIPGPRFRSQGGLESRTPGSLSAVQPPPAPSRFPDFQDSSDITQTTRPTHTLSTCLGHHQPLYLGFRPVGGCSSASPSPVSSLTPRKLEILHSGLGFCHLLSFSSPTHPCTELDSVHKDAFHYGMDWLAKLLVGFIELS